MQRHFMFRRANFNRFDAGRTADVGNARHLGDVLDLLSRLDHAESHGGRRNVDKLDSWESIHQLAAEIEVHMVELDADLAWRS